MGHSDMALAASVLASSRALFVFGVDKTPVGEVEKMTTLYVKLSNQLINMCGHMYRMNLTRKGKPWEDIVIARMPRHWHKPRNLGGLHLLKSRYILRGAGIPGLTTNSCLSG